MRIHTADTRPVTKSRHGVLYIHTYILCSSYGISRRFNRLYSNMLSLISDSWNLSCLIYQRAHVFLMRAHQRHLRNSFCSVQSMLLAIASSLSRRCLIEPTRETCKSSSDFGLPSTEFSSLHDISIRDVAMRHLKRFGE